MRLVKDIMRRNVIYFSPADSIFDIARTLSNENISGAPVIEEGKVVGVISESDIIRFMKIRLPEVDNSTEEPHMLTLFMTQLFKKELDFVVEMKKVSKMKAADFMSTEIVSIEPDATILEAAERMERHKVNRLPVIANDRLVGMISQADLLKVLVE